MRRGCCRLPRHAERPKPLPGGRSALWRGSGQRGGPNKHNRSDRGSCDCRARRGPLRPCADTKIGATHKDPPATGRVGGVRGRKSIAAFTHIVGRHIDQDQCRRLQADVGHRITSAQARTPTVFAATVRRGATVSRPINPVTLSHPRDQAFALWQGVRRSISVGRHVVRRWNPCPDPDCQIADNRLAAERTSNPLSRVHNKLLGMRSCRQQDCEDAEDGRAYRIHG